MRKTRSFYCSLLLLWAVLTPPALAAETTDHFALGQQYFGAEKYDNAYKEFYQAFLEDPANTEISFHLGRAAFESGRFEEAIMAYDRVLIMNPEAPRVKLELARAYLGLGAKEVAKRYFKEVQATNPPPQVWSNIEKFLQAIEASEKRHFVNGTFSLGMNWDDNVRLAPVDDRLSIGLFEFQLTGPSAIPQDDHIYDTTLLLNHIYKPEEKPYTWKTTGVNYNAFYERQYDLDINYFGLNSGPVFQGERYLFDVQALATHIDVEHDRYLSSCGFSSNATLIALQNFLLTAGLKVEEKNNYTDDGRDGTNVVFNAGPILLLGKNRFSLDFARETERTENEFNSYGRFSWKLRYDRELPKEMALFASLRFLLTDYERMDPLFNVFRSDEVQELGLGLSKLLWQDPAKNRALIAQLSHAYTDSQSNMDLYTYKKNVTTLNLTIAF
ncbi:surface lipoprotein assembly modifier [Thiovibrio sp. JS02]